jgi:hypothetical protein
MSSRPSSVPYFCCVQRSNVFRSHLAMQNNCPTCSRGEQTDLVFCRNPCQGGPVLLFDVNSSCSESLSITVDERSCEPQWSGLFTVVNWKLHRFAWARTIMQCPETLPFAGAPRIPRSSMPLGRPLSLRCRSLSIAFCLGSQFK